MASRAHAIPSYSFEREVSRRRRPVVFQTNDPVVLPRSRSWDVNGALIAAAAAATLLVAGATYAVFYTEPARLAETPTASLERDYVPNGDFAQLNAMKALSSPATPVVVATPVQTTSAPAAATANGFDSGAGLTPSSRSEVVIDDSAPGVQDNLPQPAENQPSAAPYPNPTTTPPDAIAPVEAPASENENPYR